MNQFEYQVTKHPAGEFQKLIYFCTEEGECNYDSLPSNQMAVLEGMLNERGSQGWELVQLFFGKDGIVALWKREVGS